MNIRDQLFRKREQESQTSKGEINFKKLIEIINKISKKAGYGIYVRGSRGVAPDDWKMLTKQWERLKTLNEFTKYLDNDDMIILDLFFSKEGIMEIAKAYEEKTGKKVSKENVDFKVRNALKNLQEVLFKLEG